uniref:RNA helicase n=1 Tax=Solanum lycopersicum TaxID=4081 RepID=A0A3Q7GDP9_SOLLC
MTVIRIMLFLIISKSSEKKRRHTPSNLPDGFGLGDHIQLLQIYEQWYQTDYNIDWCKENNLQVRGMLFVRDVRKQLSQIMQKITEGSLDVQTSNRRRGGQQEYKNLRKALCIGYANQLAERMIRHNGYRPLGFKSELVQMYIGNGGLVGTMVVWTVLWRRQWGFVICGTVSFRVESWAGLNRNVPSPDYACRSDDSKRLLVRRSNSLGSLVNLLIKSNLSYHIGTSSMSAALLMYQYYGFILELVHPSSVLKSDEDGMLPNYVVYHELIVTSRPFMRNVCAVEMRWVAPILAKLEKLNVFKLSGGSSQPDNQIQEVALTVEKKEIAAVQPPEDRASMIQAARERFLARKGQK